VNEIARAWQGAWRLAHADPNGLACFDDTVEAFWRSFRAAAIIAPGQVALLAVQYSISPPAVGWSRVAAVELVEYIVGWLAYPVAMHAVCRAIGCEGRFLRYIVAYNWSTLLQMAFFLGLALIAYSGVLGGAGGFLLIIAVIAVLLYCWFIARIGLQVGPLSAAAIVLLDFTLTRIISGVGDWMVY
jgi:hypothetical protein